MKLPSNIPSYAFFRFASGEENYDFQVIFFPAIRFEEAEKTFFRGVDLGLETKPQARKGRVVYRVDDDENPTRISVYAPTSHPIVFLLSFLLNFLSETQSPWGNAFTVEDIIETLDLLGVEDEQSSPEGDQS